MIGSPDRGGILSRVLIKIVILVFFSIILCYLMLKLTVCWDEREVARTFLVTIFQYFLSAGNQFSPDPRDLMLVLNGSLGFTVFNYRVQNQFGAYLAGLIESDGHINLPKNPNSTPRIEITFHSINFPLALKIMDLIEFGYIYPLKGQNAYRLVINNIQGLLRVVALVNGNFRTPKIASLHALIMWLNLHSGSSILPLPSDGSPLIGNAWLAGFSEGDSNFFIQFSPRKLNSATGKLSKLRIVCRYSIEQRKVEPKFGGATEPFMRLIASLFGVNLNTTTHHTPPRHYWAIYVSSRLGIQAVINYFDVFPLIGVKYLDYLDFRSAFTLIQQGEHLNDSGQLIISSLKASINKSRTQISWEHLSNFYT